MPLLSSLASLRNDDGNGNDSVVKSMIWLVELGENNRAARFFVQFLT